MKHLLFGLLVVLFLSSCSVSPALTSQPDEIISETTNTAEIRIYPTNTAEMDQSIQEVTAQPVTNETTTESTTSDWVAYVNSDTNIRLINVLTGAVEEITLDGNPEMNMVVGESRVQYSDPRWSSDGRYLAFVMERMTLLADRADFQDNIMVYDVDNGTLNLILENQLLAGFNWQPGTNILSYAVITDSGYFTGKGEVDASLAHGILGVDVESGEQTELVKPQGYSLVLPRWSADGRFVMFNEIYLMEGSGQFAYYDLETQEYVTWEKPVGGYDLSPNSELISYDLLTYTPNGEEKIFINNLTGDNEVLFSAPLSENEYAFAPKFSPDGITLAYQIGSVGLESGLSRLVVQPLERDEPQTVYEGELIGDVVWSPDGTSLLVSIGPYEKPQLVLVNLANGSTRILTNGWKQSWQPN